MEMPCPVFRKLTFVPEMTLRASRYRSADPVVWRIPYVDARIGVAQIHEPGRIRADEVPFDDVPPR